MRPARFLLLFGVVLPAVSLAALAPEPTAIMSDGLKITPTLNVNIASDDNFYNEDAGAEDDSMVYTVTPAVVLHRGDEEEYGKIEASAKVGVADVDSDDDYLDLNLMIAGRDMAARKTSVEGAFGYRRGHDARGTGNTRGCMPSCDEEPDLYNQIYARVSSQHGLEDSRGRLNGLLLVTNQNYSNNTPRTDFYDYTRYSGEFKFSWAVGGRTSAVFEINPEQYAYTENSDADSFGVTYLAGVEWDVTGKTTGYAKGGMQSKDFSSNTREDLDESTWRLGVNWTPTAHSLLNLEYMQSFKESDAVGADAIKVDGYSARFSFQPLDRVEPWLSYTSSTSEYQGIIREDETSTAAAGIDYKFRRWVVFGLSWSSTEATSDVPGLDYDRGIIALNANMTL